MVKAMESVKVFATLREMAPLMRELQDSHGLRTIEAAYFALLAVDMREDGVEAMIGRLWSQLLAALSAQAEGVEPSAGHGDTYAKRCELARQALDLAAKD